MLLIPIGVMRDNNGSMKGQYEGNVDNLAGTGLSLDDVHGVLVYVEEGHYFASTWNLEQIDARQLRWWQGINMRMQEKQRLYLREAARHHKIWLFHRIAATGHRKTWLFQRIEAARHCKIWLLQRIVATRQRKTWLFHRIVATGHRKTWLFHRIEAARHRKTWLLHRTAAMRHRRDLRIILPRRRQDFPETGERFNGTL